MSVDVKIFTRNFGVTLIIVLVILQCVSNDPTWRWSNIKEHCVIHFFYAVTLYIFLISLRWKRRQDKRSTVNGLKSESVNCSTWPRGFSITFKLIDESVTMNDNDIFCLNWIVQFVKICGASTTHSITYPV